MSAIQQAILAAYGTSAVSPAVLWPLGASSPGMWNDPAFVAASFQDPAGTTGLSAIGSVADSANPVGLILDRKAGLELGAEIVVNGDFSDGLTGWADTGADATVSGGVVTLAAAGIFWRTLPVVAGKRYRVAVLPVAGATSMYVGLNPYDGSLFPYTSTTNSGYFVAASTGDVYVVVSKTAGATASIDNISVKEIPGLHMLQATSTARPLASAKGGQTVAGDGTYSAAGYPIYQQYDGTDDGQATVTVTANTVLTAGMDAIIAIRRDSAANAVCGLYESVAEANKVFGIAESASGSGCVGSGAGTPTVWVDNTQLTGGTAVTRGTLHTALTAGDWHILEFRNLDLSTWTAAGFGLYTSYVLNGGRGPILLFANGQDANRDLARAQMAEYFGVTLP